jgi:hypothetical protein
MKWNVVYKNGDDSCKNIEICYWVRYRIGQDEKHVNNLVASMNYFSSKMNTLISYSDSKTISVSVYWNTK